MSSPTFDSKDKEGLGYGSSPEVGMSIASYPPLFNASKLYDILPYGYSRRRLLTRLSAANVERIALVLGGLSIYISAYNLAGYGACAANPELDAMLGTSDPTINSKALAAKQGGITAMNPFGMVIGALVGGYVSNLLGRTKTMTTAFIISIIGMTLQTASQNLAMFMVSRVITGFGVGMSDSVMPTWIAEISATAHRGSHIALELSFAGFGVATAYWLGFAFSDDTNHSFGWRFITGYPLIFEIIVLIVISVLPESPRWLASVGKTEEADYVLTFLHGDEGRIELDSIVESCELQRQSGQKHTYLSMLFRKDKENTRRRTWLAMLLQFMGQGFIGYGLILSYAGTVFGYAGFGARKTNILIGINGFTYAFTFFVGVYFADRIGRRPMLIQGGLGTGLMLIIIGVLSKFILQGSGDQTSMGSGLVACVFIYAAFHGTSYATIAWVWPVEVFPQATRAMGGAFSIVGFSVGNMFCTFIGPYLFTAISYNVFFFFGALSLLTSPIVYCLYPETKGRSLEDIYHLMSGPALVWQAEKHYAKVMEAQRDRDSL